MMKKRIITFLTFIVTLAVFQVCHTPAAYAGKLSEYEIICGNTNDCNMETSSCIKCEYKVTYYLRSRTWYEYHCVNKGVTSAKSDEGDWATLGFLGIQTPLPVQNKGCTDTAGRGGKIGDVTTTTLGVFKKDDNLGYNCVTDNLRRMYHSVCYSCVIVEVLISAFVKAGSKAYDVSRQLANVILVVATILWLAMYVLKSVSSFSTVEPMKMIQDILIQLFKVFVAFTIVNAGISTIVYYTVNPIINTGTDFGMAILKTINEDWEKNNSEQKALQDKINNDVILNSLKSLYQEAVKDEDEKAKSFYMQQIDQRIEQLRNSGGAK